MSQDARIDVLALDRLFEPYDCTNAPGFAVGVSLKGRPGYRRGVGMASIELPVALSPTIRMRIGSTTKHFCALAVMLLAEAGKLSIDDSPRRVLPELPEWAEPITIRQLMAHTSGMRDSLDLILHAAGPGRPTEPDTQFEMLARLNSVNFQPGASWSYNNGGYVLLTTIVERISGQHFADFLLERILEPVGMHDTMLRPLDTDLVPNSATLHVPMPGGGWSRGVFGTPIDGAGGIVSTVDDMLLWLKHMSSPVVGTTETWSAMRTPQTTHGYGLGLTMGNYRGLRTVHHAGGVVGGSSQMLKVLDHELDLIIMTNGRSTLDLMKLVDAIIDACIPDLPPLPEDIDLPIARGTFYSADSGRLLTMAEQDGKQAITFGSMTLPARSQTDGAFTMAFLPTDMRVRPVWEGDAVMALEVTEFGLTERLLPVQPPENAVLQEGHYENISAGMTVTIARDATGSLLLRITGEVGAMDYALVPVGPALWQAKATSILPLALVLEFDPDGFRLTTGRTNRLRFSRAV